MVVKELKRTEVKNMLRNSENQGSVVKKVVIVNGSTIKVMKKGSSKKKMLAEGIISENDLEMDYRAAEAVSIEKRKAKVCNKPLAIYDNEKKEAYLVDASGKRVGIG